MLMKILKSGGHLTHGFYTYSKADGCRKAGENMFVKILIFF
jgi:hypothetical protein